MRTFLFAELTPEMIRGQSTVLRSFALVVRSPTPGELGEGRVLYCSRATRPPESLSCYYRASYNVTRVRYEQPCISDLAVRSAKGYGASGIKIAGTE